MADKIKRLKDLMITNIDLVDKGANPDADIVLFKSDNKGGQTSETANEIVKLLEKEGDDKMTLQEILAKLSEEEQGVIKADIEAKEAAVVKSADALAAKEIELTKSNDELAKIKKDSGEDVKPKPEDILKSASPEVQKLFADNDEKVKKAQDDAAEAIKKADAIALAARTKEFIAKAAAYEGLPIKAEDFGVALMKVADSVDKEVYEKIENTLETADKAIVEGNLFKAEGSDNKGATGDVEKKIEKGVEEIMKSNSNLTKEQAETQYYDSHPEAYSEYEKENK